jgi:hypothetical protein
MPTIQDVRAKFPQYDDMSDTELADALHRKFYSDMPRDVFNERIGLNAAPKQDPAALRNPGDQRGGFDADNVVRSLARGIPVLGGAMDNIAAAGDAATHAVFGRGSDAPSFGERYSANLERERAQDAAYDRNHPIASAAGQIAGGVVATVPLAVTATGAKLLGMGGKTVSEMATRGAIAGGALGAVDGATRGEGFDAATEGDVRPLQIAGEAATGGALGAGVGGGVPVVARAIGSGIQALANRTADATRAPGASNAATDEVLGALRADRIDPAAIPAEAAALGPEGMLLDLGPNMRELAGSVVSLPGEGRATVVDALTARRAGATQRIAQDLDQNFGPAPVPSEVDAQLVRGQQALGPRYEDVFTDSMAVDTEHIADRLDGVASILRGPAQTAVARVRGMLNVPGTNVLDPHPSALMQTRHAIDGLMATEQNPHVIRQLTMARQEVDEALAQAVPGVKDVDAQYAELARQREGLQRGSQLLDSGKTAVRPQELAQEFPAAAIPEGAMVGPSAVPLRIQQGVRAEIDRLVGTKSNDFLALRDAVKGQGDWNRAKLVEVFGPGPASRIINAVDREAAFQEAYQTAIGNSKTAARQAGQKAFAQGKGDIPGELSTSAIGVSLTVARKIMNAVYSSITKRNVDDKAVDVARMLTQTGVERDVLARELRRIANTRAMTDQTRDHIRDVIRIIGRGSQGAVNEGAVGP